MCVREGGGGQRVLSPVVGRRLELALRQPHQCLLLCRYAAIVVVRSIPDCTDIASSKLSVVPHAEEAACSNADHPAERGHLCSADVFQAEALRASVPSSAVAR